MDSLKDTQPGKAYKILKDMGAQPGDCTDSHTFTLPNHQLANLTDQQSAEQIANHFASISQEYKPLDLDLLPDRVKSNLCFYVKFGKPIGGRPCKYPFTSPHIFKSDVHNVIKNDPNVSVCTSESETTTNIPCLPRVDRASCALNLPSIAFSMFALCSQNYLM